MSLRFPEKMPCRIQIELNDGRKLSIEKDDYEGFYTRPIPWDRVVSKFNRLASPYANEAQRSAIVAAVAQLESEEIAHLTKVLNVSFEKAPAPESRDQLVGAH
jgi:2-methylcitrate dehydratase